MEDFKLVPEDRRVVVAAREVLKSKLRMVKTINAVPPLNYTTAK